MEVDYEYLNYFLSKGRCLLLLGGFALFRRIVAKLNTIISSLPAKFIVFWVIFWPLQLWKIRFSFNWSERHRKRVNYWILMSIAWRYCVWASSRYRVWHRGGHCENSIFFFITGNRLVMDCVCVCVLIRHYCHVR